MHELGHKRIHLLKIDIEGGEYPVVEDILHAGIDIDQLLVEFHHWLPEFDPAQTRRAVQMLNDHRYRIFYISQTGREYSFVKT